MRQRVIFEESSDVLQSLSHKVLQRASCNDPQWLVSFQVPDDSAELESDIRALIGVLSGLEIRCVNATGRRPVSEDDLVHYVNSDEWWLGDVMFEFVGGEVSQILFSPYADGALLLISSCRAEGDDLLRGVVTRALTLGYEWDVPS